jgi:uncharacterized protein YqgV (UPF0045/DUF77 family)
MIKFRSSLAVFLFLSSLIQAITLPTVPTPPPVPKAIVIEGSSNNNREIKFSKRIPPNYIAHPFDQNNTRTNIKEGKIGEVSDGRISAHLRGDFMSSKNVESRLKNAGFTIITTVAVNKKKTLTSVVFTDETLLKLAKKKDRAFVATLRVLIDSKEKNINITNPLYMQKGFLQNDFDESKAKKILAKISKAFPKLTNSKDALKFQILSKYQFMKAMPKYKDTIEVASGDDLLERIQKNKRVVFSLNIDKNTTVIGIKLTKRTRSFIKKIGRANAGMLPYLVVIKDNKAIMLNPKYYISFMYPLLKMSEFMKIASIPDAMVKDAKRVFRKKK